MMTMSVGVIAGVLAVIILALVWAARRSRPGSSYLRPPEPGFPYVHMNQDGTVRELCASERDHVTQVFAPGDGTAPSIKQRFDDRNGWGSLSGYIERRRVPPSRVVIAVNPDYEPSPITIDVLMQLHQAAGHKITPTEDGFSTSHDPDVDPNESTKRATEFWLARERADEERAKAKVP